MHAGGADAPLLGRAGPVGQGLADYQQMVPFCTGGMRRSAENVAWWRKTLRKYCPLLEPSFRYTLLRLPFDTVGMRVAAPFVKLVTIHAGHGIHDHAVYQAPGDMSDVCTATDIYIYI